MKTITINVSEETYRAYQDYAASHDRSAAELIRNAMEEYRHAHLSESESIFAQEPASAGALLVDLSPDDDLLGQMLE